MKMEKALLMAAGKGSRINEISKEIPKPLINVLGKPIIESIIENLLKIDIQEIIIAVGYKKEKYLYLGEKYPNITFVENKDFDNTNTISSFYYARNHIKGYNTIILEADLYFSNLNQLKVNLSNSSYFMKKTDPQDYEWGFEMNGDDISKIVRPKKNVYLDHHMYGIAFWSKEDLNLLIKEIENIYGVTGFEYFAYDELANNIFDNINMKTIPVDDNKIFEIDTLADLIKIDRKYETYKEEHVIIDEKHIFNFIKIMNLDLRDIKKIYVNPGRSANNHNFVFDVENESYLYRIPGTGTELFCDRLKEKSAYEILKKYRITDEVVYLSEETGIKISKYYNNSRIPNGEDDIELKKCMDLLKKLHSLNIDFSYEDSLLERALRYETYALNVGGEKYFLEGHENFVTMLIEFNDYLKGFNIKKTFTHGDASINNFLILQNCDNPLLIDLEFPSKSDPFEDIATFSVDADYREKDILKMLNFYLNRDSSREEQYHVLGLAATAALMWYSWAAYKCAVEDKNDLFLDFRNDYHKYLIDLSLSLSKYKDVIYNSKNDNKVKKYLK